MSLHRLILRSLRHSTAITNQPAAIAAAAAARPLLPHLHRRETPYSLLPLRSLAFSSAEEAAAERRRRKRRLRIEPPLHALRRDNPAPRQPPDPNAPRLPDSTSALVGPRLNLHNRVQSLIRAGDLESASSVARQAIFSRTRPTVFTCNAITAAMYRAKRYDEAVALFHFFFNQSNIVPNVVSYNVLINTHCDCGRVDVGLELYRHILANAPFSPSSVTYRHMTKGLIDADRIGEAVDLLREMLSKGHGADSLVYNNLIKGFLDLGNLDKANELFDELKERCLVYDGVVNATFMDWFFNQGREKEAMESYRSLLDRQFRMTPATCNVLLECLLRHGRKKDAWALFDTMLDNHTPPNFMAVNSETFSIMVNECFKLGKFSEAVDTFRKVGIKVNSKPFSMDVAGYNNIIVKFAEHGMIEEAEKFFEELRSKSLSPDVTGYRTLIDAYLKERRIKDALQMFHRMVDANLRVIPLYANRWFSELIENNKALESSELLTKMGEKDPKPDVLTYEIVIKGLCKAGAFDQCREIISQMMHYAVGVTPSLREFLVDTFEKEGKRDEIERVLDPKQQFFGGHWQPSGAHLSRPAGAPRLPQSAVPSGSSTAFGHGENTGFSRSYESTGVSASMGATGFAGTVEHAGNTGSAYQFATQSGPMGPVMQMENPRYAGANEPAGFSGSVGHGGRAGYIGSQTGQMGNSDHIGHARNQDSNGDAGFTPQAGSTRFHGGQMGYTGTTSQFAAQTGPMWPSRHVENGGNQGAYEPAGFSSQAGLTSSPGVVGHGIQTGYTGSPNQFAAETGPHLPPGCLDDAKYQGTYGAPEFSAQAGRH